MPTRFYQSENINEDTTSVVTNFPIFERPPAYRNQYDYIGFTGSRTGQNNAGWRIKKKQGVNAASPFESDRFYFERKHVGKYRLYCNSTTLPGVYVDELGTGIKFPVQSVSHVTTSAAEAEAAALKKIYSRIRSERTSINGFNFLGELRETVRMLRHPAEALLSQVDQHLLSLENRKRKVLRLPEHKRRAEWSKAIAGTTLEINFGWKPLVSDAKAIAEAISRMIEEPPKRTRLSAQGESRAALSSSRESDDPNFAGFGRYLVNDSSSTVRTVRYIVGLQTEVEVASTALNRLKESFGFKLEDFLPTIYELTPWSWLVDYFSNIGDIIEAGTTDTSGVRWIVRTERVETAHAINSRPIGLNSSRLPHPSLYLRSAQGHSGSQIVIRRTVTRTMPTSLGLPSLIFTHPGESLSKMANLLSVVEQRRKGLQDLSGMPTYYDRFGRRLR